MLGLNISRGICNSSLLVRRLSYILIVSIISCQPNFLARMASACPVLTSYVDDSATIFASLDAELDDGVLQSWRGIARLFAAVLLARPPPGFTQRPEHLNPKLLWITIAGIAKHVDKLNVTSEVFFTAKTTSCTGKVYCFL